MKVYVGLLWCAAAMCVLGDAGRASAQVGAGRVSAWVPEPNGAIIQTAAETKTPRQAPTESPFAPEEAVAPPDPAYMAPKPAKPTKPTVGEATAQPRAVFADPTCGGESGCTSDCHGRGCGEKKCRWCCDGKLETPWTLPLPGALKDRNITIGGWISGGVYANAYGDESNGPLGFRNLATGSADQLYIFGERKINTKDAVFDWGYRADYIFGLDGPDTQAFGDQGWDYGWNSSRDYGSAIPQAYVEVGFNDLSVKAGRFFTPMGFEVGPATGRFFYSTSYHIYYAEPFTHTGVLGTYKMTDKLSGSLGWVDGWDGGWGDRNGASQLLGGVGWTPNEDINFAWYFTAGRFGDGRYSGNNGDLFFNCFTATLKLTEKLTYVFQHDYGYNYNLPGDTTTEWYGISQYLLHKFNDCWSLGGRFEWFRDDDGVRVTSDGLGRTIANPGNYYECALGVNYKPHANVTLRPEVRYDVYDGPIVHESPFNHGHSASQWSGGFDMIVTF